jgi:G:T/U-mismatch repair DNA glycosylase
MLRGAGIVLWDMYDRCDREGSLDCRIIRAVPNPVMEFIASHPSIILVGLNGGEAAKAFVRQLKRFQVPGPSGAAGPLPAGILGSSESSLLVRLCRTPCGTPVYGRQLLLWRLPSSSPVPTSCYRGFDERLDAWKRFFTIHMYGLLEAEPRNGYSGHTIWTS